MILLYAAETRRFPSARILEKRVVLDVGDEKRAAWSCQSEDRAKESIVGILLLQRAMEQVGISPVGVSMEYGAKGRPFLRDVPLDFSVSHSDGTVVCAVERAVNGLASRIAVDVEVLRGRDRSSMERNAKRWFTDGERSLLSEHPSEKDFLQIWTGKEALCKWTGEGLSRLSQCDVTEIPRDRSLRVYPFSNGVISLCHGADAVPPSAIEWIGEEIVPV